MNLASCSFVAVLRKVSMLFSYILKAAFPLVLARRVWSLPVLLEKSHWFCSRIFRAHTRQCRLCCVNMESRNPPIPQHRTLPDATKAELNPDPKPTFQPVWRLHVAGKFNFSKRNPKSSWKRIRPYPTVPAHPSYVESTWKIAGKSHPTVRNIAAWADTTKSTCVSNSKPKKQRETSQKKVSTYSYGKVATKKYPLKPDKTLRNQFKLLFSIRNMVFFWVGLIWKYTA